MKNILMVTLLFVSVAAKSQTFTEPVAYNDYIVGLQTAVGEKLIAFNNELAGDASSYESVQPYFTALGDAMKIAAEKIKTVPAYDGSSELRDAASDLFDFYVSIYNNEYKNMLELIYSPDFGAEDYETLNSIIAAISQKESGLDSRFQAAQKAFAAKYNMTLEENELQDAIEGN